MDMTLRSQFGHTFLSNTFMRMRELRLSDVGRPRMYWRVDTLRDKDEPPGTSHGGFFMSACERRVRPMA